VLFHLQGNVGANEGILNFELMSQLIEGSSVNCSQIVPQEHSTSVTLDTGVFLQACKTAGIFARSEANIVHLAIDPEANQLKVTATSAEMGESEIELDAAVEGEPIELCFNVRSLIDALSAMDGGQVTLKLTTQSSPALLQAAGSDDFVHVIMPLVVKG